MERQVIESKLLATREELSKAGPIHAKDLQKYIHTPPSTGELFKASMNNYREGKPHE